MAPISRKSLAALALAMMPTLGATSCPRHTNEVIGWNVKNIAIVKTKLNDRNYRNICSKFCIISAHSKAADYGDIVVNVLTKANAAHERNLKRENIWKGYFKF